MQPRDELKDFYARQGQAPLYGPNGYRLVELSTRDLGRLPLPSHFLGVSDPLVILDDFPIFAIPEGEGRVFLTVADVSPAQDGSNLREAYLSLIFSEEPPAAILPAVPVNSYGYAVPSDSPHGIPVDAGMVSFFDAWAMRVHLETTSEEAAEEQADGWIELMEDEEGAAMASYQAGEGIRGTIAMSRSGWGDGYYPLLKTVNQMDEILGYHIDLQVVGEPS